VKKQKGKSFIQNITFFVMILTAVLMLCTTTSFSKPVYSEDWESLSKHPVPEWFADAKFGIYAHWGVYSVPAFENEWYPRNMYIKDSSVNKHHVATYGPLSEFGYKDFIEDFKAEKFDAQAWAEIYERAGAKFAGPVAEHHDGFSMWASKVNRWNCKDMGPKRDVTGELVKALRKRGIKVVTSFHHAYNLQGYYTPVEGADTADAEYKDLYGQFKDEKLAYDRWLKKIQEVIDAYQPDQIWYDFGLAKVPDEYKRRMAAYYYNKEAQWDKEVIITRKGDHLPEGVGVLDIERGKMEKPAPFLWQTDDSDAINSWCWVQNLRLKDAEELIHELIDIVSKNGVLLLNICPRADGTIPENQEKLMYAMGDWLKVNGEAIYATRPWRIHGEGPNLYDPGRGFERDQIRFTGEDIRYTRSKDGKNLYAIVLGRPETKVTLRSVQIDNESSNAKISMLGYDGEVDYKLNSQKQPVIRIPKLSAGRLPCEYAWTFKLTGMDKTLHPEVLFSLPDAVTLTAEQAVLEGEQIKLEEKGGEQNIGFWDRPTEKIHWLANIKRQGSYTVRGEFSAAEGSTKLLLQSLSGSSTAAEIPASDGWEKPVMVNMGWLNFDKPGVYHLVLAPAEAQKWKAVNVFKIQLAPL
jgi:alpha-L-fucosidase